MNWYKIFYLFSLADKINSTLFVLSILSSVLLAIVLLIFLFNEAGTEFDKDEFKTWRRFFFTFFITFFISWSLWAFIPSKKDMLMIVAGGAVGSFITSDSSSRAIPADMTKYLHMSLQNQIKDLDDDTKKELGLQSPKETLIDKAKNMSKEQLIEYLQSDTTLTINKN